LSVLKDLQRSRTLYDLARLLRYRPSGLSFIVYRIPKDAKYTTFTIKKRGGGERRIDAPVPKLKALQRRLADILYECLREVEELDGRTNQLSHAFRKGYSIITNAKKHKARRFVLNIDLENFFPSLNFGRVRGFFLKNHHFKLAEPVATLIAQIACNYDVLPQGSPCSPIISELLTHFLDVRLVGLAARNKCSYTRYADDITFSTNEKSFPKALAVPVGEGWVLGKELESRIEDAGFTVNEAKTRMQVRASRQTVTGLTVNQKVNVPQRYYKLARAMTHSFLSAGAYKFDDVKNTSVQRLEGTLNHIYHIRERQTDLAIESEKNEDKRHQLQADRTKTKNQYPSAIRRVYSQLVFYKHFVDPARPLIVCEGPTDPIYLKSAIRKLAAAHPKLASTNNGKLSLKVGFFKYSKQSRDLLQLRGGSGDLKFFLESRNRMIKRFKHRPMKHPVIVLIDNDEGATNIFKLLGSAKFGITISHATDLPFYYLSGPLYLVKTPAKGVEHMSCIESFFPSVLLATKLDGKTFNPDKEHETAGEYSKARFAERIVRPQAAIIDFSGFDPLLARIDAVIDDYAKRSTGTPTPAARAKKP
jgi:RNA-directed DNA polymerase